MFPDATKDPRGWPAASPQGERPQEKGIDALALDFAIMAVRGEYDVGIVFSTDTDLIPALEIMVAMTGPAGEPPRAEVAAWQVRGRRGTPRLSIPNRNIYCHWLAEDPYLAVRDDTNYSPP
ncbi:MAG: NYN domain-containing protein [Frankia sp.]